MMLDWKDVAFCLLITTPLLMGANLDVSYPGAQRISGFASFKLFPMIPRLTDCFSLLPKPGSLHPRDNGIAKGLSGDPTCMQQDPQGLLPNDHSWMLSTSVPS